MPSKIPVIVSWSGEFAGREYDEVLLRELPTGVDPCGEHGEFHTFVYDGPVFQWPIAFTHGECVLRNNRFRFCELIPMEDEHAYLAASTHG